MEASKKVLRDPVTKKPVQVCIAIETGPCVACISGTSIPKFDLVGKAVDHAGVIILQAGADSIIVGPTTRSCLPAMYKVMDESVLTIDNRYFIYSFRSKTSRTSPMLVWVTS